MSLFIRKCIFCDGHPSINGRQCRAVRRGGRENRREGRRIRERDKNKHRKEQRKKKGREKGTREGRDTLLRKRRGMSGRTNDVVTLTMTHTVTSEDDDDDERHNEIIQRAFLVRFTQGLAALLFLFLSRLFRLLMELQCFVPVFRCFVRCVCGGGRFWLFVFVALCG